MNYKKNLSTKVISFAVLFCLVKSKLHNKELLHANWYSFGEKHLKSDSLHFISELEWWFDSEWIEADND